MKLRNLLFTITFIILIFLFPMSYYVFNQIAFINDKTLDIDIGEKRNKSEFNTDDSIDNLGKNIENYYNDRIPYRNLLILANRTVNGLINTINKNSKVLDEEKIIDNKNSKVLDEETITEKLEVDPYVDNYPVVYSENKQVIMGQSNWLFGNLPPMMQIYKKEKVVNDSYFEEVCNEIREIEKLSKEKNVEVYYLIAPDKQEIYEEYMPKIKIEDNMLNFPERLVKNVKENTNIDIIYPRNIIKSYKDKYRMYKKYDSHWNKISAYLATNEIYKQMGSSLPELNNVIITKKPECVSTLMGDMPPEMCDLVLLSNINYKECPPSFEYDILYNTEGKVNEKKDLCLIGDSFSIDMDRVVLLKDYENHTFVQGHDQLAKGEMLDVIKNSDVIIYELVKRYIVDEFLTNLKYIKKALLSK